MQHHLHHARNRIIHVPDSLFRMDTLPSIAFPQHNVILVAAALDRKDLYIPSSTVSAAVNDDTVDHIAAVNSCEMVFIPEPDA